MIIAHPKTEHWLDELDYGPGDWDQYHPVEQARDEVANHDLTAWAEARWETDTLVETAAWRAEVEAETGQRFTDADWLEFVTDELAARAEQAAENTAWKAGC